MQGPDRSKYRLPGRTFLDVALMFVFSLAAASGASAQSAPATQTFGGGYGTAGDFAFTLIDLTIADGKPEGKIRQPYDRTDQPPITGGRTIEGGLRFDAGPLAFDLRKTRLGLTGTVRDERGRTRPAEFLLRPTAVPPERLALYEGTFALGGGRTLTLSRSNASSGFWYLELPSGRTGFLYNVSDTEFIAGPCIYCAGPEYLHLWFPPAADGRVDRLELKVDGRRRVARRVPRYREEQVTFRTKDGTLLAGSLFLPAGRAAHPAVVFAHGSSAQTRNGYFGQIRFLAEAYARRGIAVLAFDKRGTGGSQGDWETASLSDLADDVAAGVRYLRSRSDIAGARIGLTGSSQAGWIMPMAASRVPGIRFIQHRSAASPMGVREQERRRLMLQMQVDKYPAAEIERALRVRDMMDDFAVTGQGWERLEAAAKTVEKEYWMTQFIGGLPGRDAPDWAWLRENFLIDTTPDFVNFRGSWQVLYGDKDPIAPIVQGQAMLEAAVRRGKPRELTIEVVPNATHNYLDARTGAEREFPGLRRFVPGIYDKIVDWAAMRLR